MSVYHSSPDSTSEKSPAGISRSSRSCLKSCLGSLSELQFRQPCLGFFDVVVAEFMSSPMPKQRYVSAAALEYSPEFFRLASGNDWIPITRANKNGNVSEIPNDVRR